ncbi:hypothetical protein ACVWYG_002560 [Pedobacter sp. UYEF25]
MERLIELEKLIEVYKERLVKWSGAEQINILYKHYVKIQDEIITIQNEQIENLKRQIK